METAALVAPITGLEFFKEEFLLTGEGPILSVYSLQPQPKASTSLSVLQQSRIHGIRVRSQATLPAQSSATSIHKQREQGQSSTTEPSFYDLAVFGGKAVRLVRLRVNFKDVKQLRLEVLGPLLELHDWVLDARWLSGDKQSLLCVAVAHNGVLLLDAVRGEALVQHSCLEGCLLYSALLLVHESLADTVLIGGTVFNQLVIWKPGREDESKNSRHKAPVERRLSGHSGVIFSISYLQEKGYLASASDDRSVRVWGVGALGGPGGKCGDLNPACLKVLYGHQARVFSVHLSPGRVFSAGEDGTCLIWDWAGGGKVVRTLKGHRAGGVRALAVSEGEGGDGRLVATGGADGGVRLWKVHGSDEKESKEEAVTEKLTDLQFSGSGLPKVVCIAGEEDENATWSQFVVCTDKGVVCQYVDGKWETLWQGTSDFHSYCVMDTVTVSVKGSAATVHLCAVGNLSGSLQVLPTSHPQSGILLSGGSGKIHSIIWQKGKDGVYLLASGAEGLVYRWCIKVKINESCSLVFNVNCLPPFLLPRCAKRWLTAAVRLHSSLEEVLWVCGDRRGSLLLYQEEEKFDQNTKEDEEIDKGLMADRKQAADEQEETQESKEAHDLMLQPLSCLFGVHGKHGVTSVCEYQGLLYSTGKDGCVRIFRVNRTPPEKCKESKQGGKGERVEIKERLQLEMLRVQRACKGMEWLERVLILESEVPVEQEEEVVGECEHPHKTKHHLTVKLGVAGEGDVEKKFEAEDVKGREARFVTVGFHAAHFVVWDPMRQERLLAVPCGGGHRSWSLWPSHTGIWSGYGALVFIKQGAVLTSQAPGEVLGWVGKSGRSGGCGLREGVHGRGIWCVARLGRIGEFGNEILTNSVAGITENVDGSMEGEEGKWEIVVTGGEDTSLAVLALHPVSGIIKVLSVITDHISGVRTVAAVPRAEGGRGNPSQPLSALLVSAGGRAQIQCYQLLIVWDRQRLAPSCQVIQVANHRLDEQWEKRRNRHKTVKVDPETRYVSVTVVEEKDDCVVLALSCSDGAIRLFSVNEVKNQIDLLWETFYHHRCVLSVATCSLDDDNGNRYKLLFSAATDGKIAVWDLTEALSLSTDHLSGATPPPIPCLDIPAHQSGINSLVVWEEKRGQQEGGCLVTVASGGDDGQLTVSTVKVQYPENGKIGGSSVFSQISNSQTLPQAHVQSLNQLQLHLHSQSQIPLAHAAPLTALKLLSPDILVSTSSDQRICLWKVSSTTIHHSGALCSHVADAAGLAVWEGEEGDEKEKITFEQVNAVFGGKESRITEDGTFREDLKTGDESKGREPVEAMSKSGGPVCETSDENECETTVNSRDQAEYHSGSETASEANTKMGFKGSGESRPKRTAVGWVLVVGQGFQLLQVRIPEMGEKVSREKREEESQRVKVTLQNQAACMESNR
ncbi:tRNA (34-2'-O)-methyltransferase regulator WDR6 [Odontesthes bonariensis]|uniref:tRNA (34-2'-O)-methyltransferase regulator WDR6 n=1 Tax=Odontesthes bonariensis TaxID=219752 RepID=UPI003F580F8E